MLKERFLKPLINYRPSTHIDIYGFLDLNPDKVLNFLKSLTDDDIKELKHAIIWLYPHKIRLQLVNKRRKYEDYSFIDDFRAEYGLSDKYTTKEKAVGLFLFNSLKNSKITDDIEMIKKMVIR